MLVLIPVLNQIPNPHLNNMDDRLTLRPTPWLHARGGFLSPPSTTAWARGLSMSMITNVCVQNRVQKKPLICPLWERMIVFLLLNYLC